MQRDVNMKRLWELAHEGKSAEEIMKELDIREMSTLKNALDEMMFEKGLKVHVPGLIGKSSIHPEYTDNGIRIPPAMLEGTEFHRGDHFVCKTEGGKIILEKANS